MSMNESFSTLTVAPHPATYIPQPIHKKKSYVPPKKREAEPPSYVPIMDSVNFPSLNTSPLKACAPAPLNYLSKIKEAEAKREEDSLYNPATIALMTRNQLIKEGWAILNKESNFTDGDMSALIPPLDDIYAPLTIQKPAFPLHPDSPRRRRLVSQKSPHVEMYDIDFNDTDNGATVPILDDEWDDGESSV